MYKLIFLFPITAFAVPAYNFYDDTIVDISVEDSTVIIYDIESNEFTPYELDPIIVLPENEPLYEDE